MIEMILSVVKSETILAALIGAAASLMAGLTAQYFKKLVKKRQETGREEIRQTVAAVSLDLGTFRLSRAIEGQPAAIQESSEALIQKMERQVLERVSAVPDMTEEQIKEEVINEMREFEDRVEKIARRSPEDVQLDKIASMNDAILSERIGQLSERIASLESKALSHLDVAVTVSTVIGGIFAVVAAIYALLIFISDSVR
jgi:hypothetical protein